MIIKSKSIFLYIKPNLHLFGREKNIVYLLVGMSKSN